ncbi:MAG: hypothetical protein VCA36_08075 [Opitutales bacterium]
MIDSQPTDSSNESTEPAPEGSPDSPTGEPTSSSSSSSLVSGGELTEEGKKEVARWIDEGLGLSEVQKRLAEEHGLTLTYMETRFLVDDLELALQDAEEPQPSVADKLEDGALADGKEGLEGAADSSGISVEVDKVVRPGAIVSGTVTFSDGVSLQWHLDQMSRLAIAPKEDYQPSEEDLMAFQEKLQVELRKAGF